MKNKGMQYLPLCLVELYLGMTILLMQFGPIQYNLQNQKKFWLLIVLYHVAFVVGYILFSKRKQSNEHSSQMISDEKIRKMYWIVLAICFVVWLVVYRNATHAKSYIPYELPAHFVQGLLHPAQRYYWKLTPEAIAQFNGNKLVTGISSIFYPAYYFMPILLIVAWDKISKAQKLLSYLQIFLTMAMGISVATNKYLFDLLFLLGGGFAIELFCRWKTEKLNFFKTRKVILFTIIFLAVFDICYFTYNIRDRTGNLTAYIDSTSEDVSVTEKVEEVVDEPALEVSPNVSTNMSDSPVKESVVLQKAKAFLSDMLVALESYICQGYYGFSLALDQEFTTTYGLGHSTFCISTIKGVLGIDLGERTFQEKISDKWSSTSRWHSFYSQMANDVGFYGVIGIMFVIGVILSAVWRDAHENSSIVAKCLLMLFVIMFLYMPANNQVGNVAGTFFAFWEMMVLWTFLRIRSNRKKEVL